MCDVFLCVCVQVLYNEKDSEGPPSVQVAEGEGSVTLLLGVLQKYTMYMLQVLAYTRLGDGPPSNPILVRTKEDGRISLFLGLITDLSAQHFVQHVCILLTSVAIFHLFTPLLSAQLSACLSPYFTDHPLGSAHPSDPPPPRVQRWRTHCVCVYHVCRSLQMQRSGNHGRHFRMPTTWSGLFE